MLLATAQRIGNWSKGVSLKKKNQSATEHNQLIASLKTIRIMRPQAVDRRKEVSTCNDSLHCPICQNKYSIIKCFHAYSEAFKLNVNAQALGNYYY